MSTEKSEMGGNQLRNASSIISSGPGPQIPMSTAHVPVGVPPPLPPRQPIQSYSGYNDYRPFGSSYYGSGYSSGYGSYGNNYYGRGYGNYGFQSGYGPYSSSNYGQFGGYGGDVENRFIQYAEESTRPTLHVVESILHTFSSVTMMLESTYFAMTNSLRAILSVAENVTRVRSTIGQLLSTLTLIRLVKWFYKRIMYMLGLQHQDPMHEEIWKKSASQSDDGNKTVLSAWGGFIFFALFVAIPYLIHKISSSVKQIQVKGMDPKEWSAQEDPVYSATVTYDFVPVSNEELPLRAGQKIWLAPQSLQSKNTPGWLKATDGVKVGLVPYNYITVVGQLKKRTDLKNSQNLPQNKLNQNSAVEAGSSQDNEENTKVLSSNMKEDSENQT